MDEVTSAELYEVKMSLMKLEKDLDTMTSAVTKLANTMESLAPVIIELQYMKRDINSIGNKVNTLEQDVAAIEEAQAASGVVNKILSATAYLLGGAGIAVLLKHISGVI